MHLRKIFGTIGLLLFTIPAIGQINTDSLESVLNTQLEPNQKVFVLNKLAEGYWGADANKTINYGNDALRLAQSLGDRYHEAYALHNLSQGYLYNDEYDRALEFGLQAIEIRKELGNQEDLAFTYRTIGWLYFDMENPDKALEYHLIALDIYNQLGMEAKLGTSFNGIGLIHAQKGNFRTALGYFERSLEVYDSLQNQWMISVVYSNMALAFIGLEQHKKAIDYLNQSLEINKVHPDAYLEAGSWNRLGRAWLSLGNFAKSEQSLDAGLKLVEGLDDDKVYLMENYEIRSDLYEALNQYEKSLKYYKLFTDVRNEIISEDKNQKLNDIRLAFEREKNETEAQLSEQMHELEIIRYQILIGSLIFVVIIALLVLDRIRSYRKNKNLIRKAKKALRTASISQQNH